MRPAARRRVLLGAPAFEPDGAGPISHKGQPQVREVQARDGLKQLTGLIELLAF